MFVVHIVLVGVVLEGSPTVPPEVALTRMMSARRRLGCPWGAGGWRSSSQRLGAGGSASTQPAARMTREHDGSRHDVTAAAYGSRGALVDATAADIVVNMAGERVPLGPLRRELFPLHGAWVNDPEIGWNIFGVPRPRTNVMLVVFGYNLAARRLYERIGFREIGRRRQSLPRDGRWWNEIYMDCLASEFDASPSQAYTRNRDMDETR